MVSINSKVLNQIGSQFLINALKAPILTSVAMATNLMKIGRNRRVILPVRFPGRRRSDCYWVPRRNHLQVGLRQVVMILARARATPTRGHWPFSTTERPVHSARQSNLPIATSERPLCSVALSR